jgi:hypothetical protein
MSTLTRRGLFFGCAQAVASLIGGLKKLRKALVEIGVESEAVRSDTVNDIEAFLWRLS